VIWGSIECLNIFKGNSVPDFVDKIYPDLQTNAPNDGKVILTPINKDVDYINNIALKKIQSPEIILLSADSIQCDDDDDATMFPPEVLNSINQAGLPPHDLRIKRGTPVILLRNLQPRKGLCNGTRLIVEHASPFLLTAKITN
jgi:hypothetical protein